VFGEAHCGDILEDLILFISVVKVINDLVGSLGCQGK
jgi:hypothetical protein